MKSEFPGPVPEIPVRDIATAAAYYQKNLGFHDGNFFRVFYDFATPERAKEVFVAEPKAEAE